MKTFKQMQLCSIILAVIGLSTSLTSCQKSEETNPSTGNLTLGATINPPTTKGELNGKTFTWCSGDKLQVYDGLTGGTSLSSTTFDIAEQDTYTNNASFTGTIDDWNSAFNFYIVYPVNTMDASSSEAKSTSTYDEGTSTLKLTLPCNQIQKYDAENVLDPEMTDKYDYKIGTIENQTSTEHLDNVTLSNLMTLIGVNITKPSEEMQITKVVVRSNNDLFPTEYDYSVANSTGEYVNKISSFTLSLLDADSKFRNCYYCHRSF